jgi:YVTN family beta-propeller protein
MSSPARRSRPAGRRPRRDKARIYRRRRLVALVVAVVVIAALAGVVWAAAGGCGADEPSAAAGGASAGKDDARSPSPRATAWTGPPSSELKLELRDTIVDPDIAPKSVVSSGTGYVFAQNMMYKHTITVYDTTTLKLVETVPDAIDPAEFRIKGHGSEDILGAPVECAFLPDGRFAYVSQYSMYGPGFVEGHDAGSPGQASDSYVYRVSLADLAVDKVIKVGEVPKYVAVTPDSKYVLVSNWQSFTLSVIDVRTSKVVKNVSLGPYPRGIAISPDSKTAYVAVMGTTDIAVVDLTDFSVSWINGVGAGPRHLCMAGNGKYLYATLNNEGNVAKIDPRKKVVVDKVYTGAEPRSMDIAPDGKSLFVVNYSSNTMSHVRTSDMKVIDSVGTNGLPIGITYDAPTRSVWVCCYSGSIMVFDQV